MFYVRVISITVLGMVSDFYATLFLIRETVTAALQLLPETPHKKRCRRQESSCPHLLVSTVGMQWFSEQISTAPYRTTLPGS